MKNVPRIGRILDLAGLALFLGGVGFYSRAWFGFQGLPTNLPENPTEQWAAIAVADGFLRMQRLGAVLMALGVLVFIVAWRVAKRVNAQAPA